MKAAGFWREGSTAKIGPWKYKNTRGETLTVTRMKTGSGEKTFKRLPMGLKGPCIPYCMDEIDADREVVLVEGEKCADRLRSLVFGSKYGIPFLPEA